MLQPFVQKGRYDGQFDDIQLLCGDAGAPPPIVDARTGEAISDIPGRTMVAATVVLERLWSVEDGSYAGYLRIVHAKVYRPPSTIVYT